jgi:hypothetical protein
MAQRSRRQYRYRITYRRAGWTQPQSRFYTRRSDAEKYIRLLHGNQRPDLYPIVKLELHRQEVGPWEAVEA